MASRTRISRDTVQRAVTALLKWKKSRSNKNSQLFDEDDDDFIYLQLTLNKIPQKDRTLSPQTIPLLHPLHSSLSSNLCLIIPDKKFTFDEAIKKIKSHDIPVTKLLKLSKLKSDYKSFESKGNLYSSHDVFFADKRVVHLLPKLLGKQFYGKKKKAPVPVDLRHENWKEQIERACSSTLLCLSTGTCSVVRVGKVTMESGDIVENVIAAIEGVVEVVPKKWAGMRAFHLKFSRSLALPVYQALPKSKGIIEGIEGGDDAKLKGKKDGKLVINQMGSADGLPNNGGDGNKVASAEFVRRKRKEQLVGELNREKRAKKMHNIEDVGDL